MSISRIIGLLGLLAVAVVAIVRPVRDTRTVYVLLEDEMFSEFHGEVHYDVRFRRGAEEMIICSGEVAAASFSCVWPEGLGEMPELELSLIFPDGAYAPYTEKVRVRSGDIHTARIKRAR